MESSRLGTRSAHHEPGATEVRTTASLQTSLEQFQQSNSGVLPGSLPPEAMSAYQQTMQQFLHLQEQVMNLYLGGQQKNLAAPVPGGILEDAVMTPHSSPVPQESIEEDDLPQSETTPSLNVTELVLSLVSERTGYPPEMLGLDQDMEADLGIDSIKRVEILGGIQKNCRNPSSTTCRKISRCSPVPVHFRKLLIESILSCRMMKSL